eukprot:CAMPEP_0117422774 /NCGR_PEP_ID=MMETSP0758-20121206/3555_1 /TAXON_ID=63605 /ORGANISM="Percolomonas cosmopolitus, Strain AE-1 (ATCC 50343)" /LENGTH=124 /DNA_ID=CAMNT_0005205613 /DNA_START=1905 /DNA_END=2280 /DNA_ORIENTATION=-
MTVVPYIAKFATFFQRMEAQIPSSGARGHIEEAYAKLIQKMLKNLNALANTNAKHKNIFLMKNYAYLIHVIGNINTIPTEKQEEEESIREETISAITDHTEEDDDLKKMEKKNLNIFRKSSMNA